MFSRHPSLPHIAKSITSVPNLLWSKCAGNYGSMDTDIIIYSDNNVLHLKAHNFQKVPMTFKSSYDLRWWGQEAILQKKLRLSQLLLHNLPRMNHSTGQLVASLDSKPGMILCLMLLPIYHTDSIHNCRSVYFQNYHIKTDALPTYFRGVKHILMGFFFATAKFPVLFLPLIFKEVFRNELFDTN